MARNSGGGVSLVFVAIIFLVVGWFGHQYFGDAVYKLIKNIPTEMQGKSATNAKQEVMDPACMKVITPARNPKTGDIQEFPTTCSVPEGWLVIENDVPGL
jgi:hypothetical protein